MGGKLMTVAQLITALQGLDPTLEVLISGDGGYMELYGGPEILKGAIAFYAEYLDNDAQNELDPDYEPEEDDE